MNRAIHATLFLALLAGACSTSKSVRQQIVTVEGRVSAAGNEPFVNLRLVTTDRHAYILKLERDDERLLYRSAPVAAKVSGFVYPDLWGTGMHAWLEVQEVSIQSSEHKSEN